MQGLDACNLHWRAGTSREAGLDDTVVDSAGIKLPASLLDQFAAVGEEEDPSALRGGLRDDGACDDRFARGGGCDKQDSPPASRDLTVELPDGLPLIGTKVGLGTDEGEWAGQGATLGGT